MARSLFLNISVFFAVFVPLSVTLSELDRYPYLIREKLLYYEQHQDEFDSLIVGSSYAFFGANPLDFDAAMQEQGIESSTFNLAIFGLTGHEIDELLRLALKKDRHGRIKRVLVDMRPLQASPMRMFAGTDFEIWWHSFGQTRAVLRTLLGSSRPVSVKARLTLRHVSLFFENHLPLGTARRLYRQAQTAPEEDWFWRSLSIHRGYEPLDPDAFYNPYAKMESNVTVDMLQQRHRMLKLADELHEDRNRLMQQAGAVSTSQPDNLIFWQDQSGLLRKRNIFAVHMIMPAFYNPFTAEGRALLRAGAVDHFLSFNDPGTFPELFDIENRFEFGHLNQVGASLFSRRLGEETAAFLKNESSLIETARESDAPTPPGR